MVSHWIRSSVGFHGPACPCYSWVGGLRRCTSGSEFFRRCPIPSRFSAAWFPMKPAPLFLVKVICFWHATNRTRILLQELVDKFLGGPWIKNLPSSKRIQFRVLDLLFFLKTASFLRLYSRHCINLSRCNSIKGRNRIANIFYYTCNIFRTYRDRVK